MQKILVDTDVLIDYSKGMDVWLRKLLHAQQDGKLRLILSPVNVTEYLNDHSLDSPGKREMAMRFLDIFKVVEIDREIGEISAQLLREGKIQFLGDALIAAVCLKNELTIFTRNKKHFEKIKEIRIASSNFF